MKKEFWIKKDPVKDGQDNWKKLSSYEFARFMETADGKSRKENIARIPGGEPGEPIIYMEVDSQTAKEWKRENNRACYLQKTMNALGIEVISYNVSPNVEDWEVNGEALLEDPDCHVEDDVLRSILTENMLDAMCHLSEIEQKVITHLYLSDEPMTEHEFEKAFGVKRCTVHYYKVSALEKLREMLGENV
ncbi:MAG: hypothetical protein ACLR5H_06670 [Oscillospiraceae bacterium]